ncbi:MAG: hypothetical protein QOF33_2982, partial [Thermomicrobiales bacterium]|nr:hypothetical protein [Thermomicrobiales bacterium]
ECRYGWAEWELVRRNAEDTVGKHPKFGERALRGRGQVCRLRTGFDPWDHPEKPIDTDGPTRIIHERI